MQTFVFEASLRAIEIDQQMFRFQTDLLGCLFLSFEVSIVSRMRPEFLQNMK